jgi:Pentapeptide repeats (8 copies)
VARYAVFDEADLAGITAKGADLRRATFDRAWLTDADLSEALLTRAKLSGARVRKSDLSAADLCAASCAEADLRETNLSRAHLRDADLSGTDLGGALLTGADLAGADLSLASLVRANLGDATLTGARVFGVSAWHVELDGAKQEDLLVTQPGEPPLSVDDLELASLVYLFLDNRKIRGFLDTVTAKTVLILGRFTPTRKAVLDAIRDFLRTKDLVSIVFDFDPSAARNLSETVTLLATMSRFIIADLTDPSSVPAELATIVREVKVPLQPLIEGDQSPFALFDDLLEEEWVLEPYRYKDAPSLLHALGAELVPALEEKRRALIDRRSRIAASGKESR